MDFYNYIEAYEKGAMDPKLREQMDAAIAADPDLREAVENYDKIEPVLDLLLEEDLRAQMEIIKKEHGTNIAPPTKPTVKTRTLSNWKWWSLAAAVGLFVGVLFMTQENVSPQQHYADAYSEPIFSNNRNIERDSASSDIKPSVSQEEALYISAHEAFNKEDFTKARDLLLQISTADENRSDEIEWFIMLSYGVEGNESKARELLDVILSEPDHFYNEYDHAEKLLKKLTE